MLLIAETRIEGEGPHDLFSTAIVPYGLAKDFHVHDTDIPGSVLDCAQQIKISLSSFCCILQNHQLYKLLLSPIS